MGILVRISQAWLLNVGEAQTLLSLTESFVIELQNVANVINARKIQNFGI